jgi:hypothetical protein
MTKSPSPPSRHSRLSGFRSKSNLQENSLLGKDKVFGNIKIIFLKKFAVLQVKFTIRRK